MLDDIFDIFFLTTMMSLTSN